MRSVLLKLSGEALGGPDGAGLDRERLAGYAGEIAAVRDRGIRLGIVVGAGNFLRGRTLDALGIPRMRGDVMGMVATVLNGLALESALESRGVPSAVLSAFAVSGVVDAKNAFGDTIHTPFTCRSYFVDGDLAHTLVLLDNH